MYAVIRTGGKQAKVKVGDVIDVERLKDAGEEVEFTPLLVVTEKGKTIAGGEKLEGAKVKARVLGENRGDKIDVFKYKAKTGYRKRGGHRQTYTRLEILGVELSKTKAKKPADKE